jgi:hypothetical protein
MLTLLRSRANAPARKPESGHDQTQPGHDQPRTGHDEAQTDDVEQNSHLRLLEIVPAEDSRVLAPPAR